MKFLAVAIFYAAACVCAGQGAAPWLGYGGNAQHTALSSNSAQSLETILWQAPVDLAPQYSGEYLFIHYGEPMVTAANTILIPVKVGAAEGFRIDAKDGVNGLSKWSAPTDYVLPPHTNIWTPSYPAVLTPQNRLYFAGPGGTVYFKDDSDSTTGAVTGQFAFYGFANYPANSAALNSHVFICTPLTSDAAGNIYFGFYVTSGAPLGLVSGYARIQPDGTGSSISAQAAAGGDPTVIKPVFNCAPALSTDGTKLYAAASNTISTLGNGRLFQLNAATMTYSTSVVLRDPSGSLSNLPDDGTASPVIGPDGDVYFGVLENPFPGNNDRGWLMHFSADLATQKITGAFGWDDTPSIVPATMIPSYNGGSAYLLAVKYNNYAGIGSGNGVNKLAILDPNVTQTDSVSGRLVMKEVLTIAGVTPDEDLVGNFPLAVREWCINTAAVDPATSSVYAGCEDGKLYRWHLPTNTFLQIVTLTPGLGEAYTPTLIGPTGVVYAINNATLFAVGTAVAPVITSSPPPAATTVNTVYSLTYTATGTPLPAFSVVSGSLPTGLSLNATTGALTGIPTVAGTFSGTVKATNIAGSDTQAFSITINPAITLSPTLPNGKIFEPYAQAIVASGGTGTKTFSVTAGTLPNGLTLNTNGTLTGTPTQSGQFSFVVTATDSVGAKGEQGYTLTILGLTVTVAPAALPDATVGVPYSVQFSASGGAPPYTFGVTGALPAGLTLSSTGLLSGPPTAGGSFNFSVTASDSGANSFSGTQAETLTVNPPLISIAPGTLPAGSIGELYNQTITASGGTAPYSFALVGGNLPPGLALTSSGIITGTPTTEGTFAFTVSATDASTGTGPFGAAAQFSISIDSVPEFLSGIIANPNPAVIGSPVTFSAAMSPADAIVTWDFGVSGIPNATGQTAQHTYSASGTYTVTATGENPRSHSKTSASISVQVIRGSFVPGTIPLVAVLGNIKFAAIDTATVTAYFQLPQNQPIQGLPVTISVGGLTRTFTFDAKGNATAPDAKAKLRLQRFKAHGVLGKLTVNYKGALHAAINTTSFVDDRGVPTQLVITVSIPNATFTNITLILFKQSRTSFTAKF